MKNKFGDETKTFQQYQNYFSNFAYDIVEESYELSHKNELDKLLLHQNDPFDNFEEEDTFLPSSNGIYLLCMGMEKQNRKKRKKNSNKLCNL